MLASDPGFFDRFRRWALDGAVTLGGLVTSICEWGVVHQEEIGALDVAEARRLVRMFGYLIGEFVDQAEASERVLLAELLEGINLGGE